MHIASAALELLAYTPSTKHFGLSNTQLLGVIIGAAILVWALRKRR